MTRLAVFVVVFLASRTGSVGIAKGAIGCRSSEPAAPKSHGSNSRSATRRGLLAGAGALVAGVVTSARRRRANDCAEDIGK
jgi:hypothetical protein